MTRLAALAILCCSTIAAAEGDELSYGRDPLGEPNGYVAGGVVVGKNHFRYDAFAIEAASRLFDRSPLFGRLEGQAGTLSLDNAPGTGTFAEGRIGLEGRSCTHQGMLCGSLGLDVGLYRGRFDPGPVRGPSKPAVSTPTDTGNLDSVIAVPRLTLDGGARIRVRGVLELPSRLRAEHGSETGVAFSLALGVGF